MTTPPDPEGARRLDDPELIPFLPMICSAWSDGLLSPAELRAWRAHADAQSWLSDEARATLDRWLDPDDPPSPEELARLLDTIRSAGIPPQSGATASLTDLGLALARAGGVPAAGVSSADAVDGLR